MLCLCRAESQARSGVSSRGRSTKPRRYAGATESEDDVSEGTNKRRKHHNPWSAPILQSALYLPLPRVGVWPLITSLLWQPHASPPKLQQPAMLLAPPLSEDF